VRVFLAMFSHETNTFSNIPTDRKQFEAHGLRYGGEILETYRGTGTCLGGMIEAAERHGMTLVPSIAAAASPAGRVTTEIYEHVKGRLLSDLRAAGRLDGVLLDLHGAMVPETCDPTCTAFTALMVPVASTTLWISPRSALAVKYCGLSLRPKLKAANMATATTIATSTVHLLFRYFIRTSLGFGFLPRYW